MKRFLFAAALVALVASVGTAEQPATITTAPAAPVVVTTAGTPVAEYAPAQTQRRGLFGRLRNRNTGTMNYSTPAPVITTPTTGAAPMPGIIAPQPMPMPGSRTSTSRYMPMTMPGTTIAQATGNLPPGIYTTTDGTVIQVGGSQMMPTSGIMTAGGTQMMTNGTIMPAGYTVPAQTQPRGLFGRRY
jgi:hypothetical protein